MEKRIETVKNVSPNALPYAKVPEEYLSLVQNVINDHFSDALRLMAAGRPGFRIVCAGRMYQDEIVLSVSFLTEGALGALTLHSSADFDPQASSPSAQELLSTLVDTLGQALGDLLDQSRPKRLQSLIEGSLSAMSDVPFHWSPMEVNKRKTWVKLDTSNPEIERMTDDWLSKNDPEFEREVREADAAQLEETARAIAQKTEGTPGKKGPSTLH